MIISLEDLGLAYRKAKVDLYYSSHVSLEAIAEYEESLHTNLTDLQGKIQRDDESWVEENEFTGNWFLASKSVDMTCWEQQRDPQANGLIFSSPAEKWTYACNSMAEKSEQKKIKAEFRVMAQCSLDFHVLSTLWMLKVGHLFDAKLSTCAYGNRLRRTLDGKDINALSIGSFQPYLRPFRDWRDNGINAMRSALSDSKRIVALTADVSSFYHELNPGFMLDPTFVKDILELELTAEQSKLNRLFINALKAWAIETPLKKGLPVGLPASAVVANVALIELDRVIEQQVAPIYYGRYVDDIMLVMENGANFRSMAELWQWLFARSSGKLDWVKGEENKQISFQPNYLHDSQIRFANAKNKVFILAGDPGKTLVEAIAHQIYERASEWRAMPRLPHSSSNVGTDLLAATQSNGEVADNLRKADALTMRRAGFAIKLRDFEAYERDLQPGTWKGHRQAFFRAFIDHVMVLPQFFDLSVYLPRVIRLATACEDFVELRKLIFALENICNEVRENCLLAIKACPDDHLPSEEEIIGKWRTQLFSSVLEAIVAAFPPRISKVGKQTWNDHLKNWHTRCGLDIEYLGRDFSLKGYQEQQARLFSFDLAHMPFRFIGLPKEMIAQRGIPAPKTVAHCAKASELLPDNVVFGNQVVAKWCKFKILPHGLLFATRPFSLPEIFILNNEAYTASARQEMRAVVLAVRGFVLGNKTPCIDKQGVLQIPDGQSAGKYGVAVSSWKTSMASWTAAVMRSADQDANRYTRLCRLLDGVIAQPHNSRYLILPELSLPAHWFIRIARKLQGRGISLVTGIEYLHANKARVRNQVWASLSHDGLGFPSLMIYRQDKQRPALHEEQELQRLAGLEMKPEKKWTTPPIIQHGDFRFSLLICSELTNISYRAALRGNVDALFVPEWNQDTETFNALVESAALDIHAYIIQCNDRQYGDSRIRGPFKDSWKRDVLRVKGGITDYCVIGEVDVNALRQFQSSYRSPGKPFKPVPDGFEIEHSRKMLPEG
ncbi:Reverse transcriptase [Yersinia ruckeri]|uniref:reverse transcriptase domain-containing protein n=1 Tax=Yersinia ruckeri TaxID=29486 RepID=UPI0020C07E95|nr:reverse transcriptase domain-containing protein [Yersinia ruckeri]ELI6451112.1 reverse transcriptase [Yersinia ruckeri]MCK8565645.1 Reverse transcriptase [Yersinia ruckeri]MCK8584574.1 Reverse transcriptase [Yersinia ruckeri]UZY18006.1 reverse transcriptase domain-containing protein [Yersinia ruckeri]